MKYLLLIVLFYQCCKKEENMFAVLMNTKNISITASYLQNSYMSTVLVEWKNYFFVICFCCACPINSEKNCCFILAIEYRMKMKVLWDVTRCFKYDWDYLCVNKSQFVLVILLHKVESCRPRVVM
jgi:hypothetical protein